MKIKIISDIHCDINKTFEFGFSNQLKKVDATIIAGDIAGSWKTEMKFLDRHKDNNRIICVGGNHLGYDYRWDRDMSSPINGIKEDSIDKMRKKYDGSNNINYLENDYIIVGDKIVFGGTMYTDFKLYGEAEKYKKFSERDLNDFRNVYTYDEKDNIIRPVCGDDYQNWFKLFLEKLNKCLNETKHKDVIVVSHFAPSKKSISQKYSGGLSKYLNPSYASDLEEFIKNNPRIKLWVHGHMHDCFDYKIGNCRIVCEPYGYYYENYLTPKEYNGRNIILK